MTSIVKVKVSRVVKVGEQRSNGCRGDFRYSPYYEGTEGEEKLSEECEKNDKRSGNKAAETILTEFERISKGVKLRNIPQNL